MTETNVFKLSQPGMFTDLLTEVLRNGARSLLVQAVEAEVADFLSQHADKLTEDGHNQLPKLIQGVKFTDGIEVIGNDAAPQAQAAA